MPYINDTQYLSLPQQVKKNKDDINNVNNLETTDKTLVGAINENKGRIDENELSIIVLEDNQEDQQEQIDDLRDTLAQGGQLVTRRVETGVDTIGTGTTVKMNYSETTKRR